MHWKISNAFLFIHFAALTVPKVPGTETSFFHVPLNEYPREADYTSLIRMDSVHTYVMVDKKKALEELEHL